MGGKENTANIVTEKLMGTIFPCVQWQNLWRNYGCGFPSTPTKPAKPLCALPAPFPGFFSCLPQSLLGAPRNDWSRWDPFLPDPVTGTLAAASFPYPVHCPDNCCDISFLFCLKETLRQEAHSSRKRPRPALTGWLGFMVRCLALPSVVHDHFPRFGYSEEM